MRGPSPKGGGQKEAHGGVLLRTGCGALQRASSKGKGRCPCGILYWLYSAVPYVDYSTGRGHHGTLGIYIFQKGGHTGNGNWYW